MAGDLFDAVVIGTGFGGAVAACRLAQAGKTICILERGRRYAADDFPRPATRPDNLPQTARWAWAVDQGLWDVKDLQGTLAVQAAGYGGGSLVYANVHLRPPAKVFAQNWPDGYDRPSLDPYYDTVAAVLGVQPLPERLRPPSPVTGALPKAQAMAEAATALGRQAWFFRPPLAIDFTKCTMRGECIAGCPVQAKNTLDLNYLMAAEKVADTDIRTLAEATCISEEADGYTVTYHDHITGSDATVRGKSVFLCAGAVGSTHLMFRSRDKLCGMPVDSKNQIGCRFFANGDAIAMVYDTTGAPTPTLGPTITTTVLYNNSPERMLQDPAEWFVLQDGGYPKWLEPIMGLFRGDVWLERNAVERIARSRRSADADAAARSATALTDQIAQMTGLLRDLMDARSAIRRPAVRLKTLGMHGVLPRQIDCKLVPDLHDFVARREREEATAVSLATLAEVGKRMIADCFPGWLVNFGLKQAKPFVVPSTLEILHQHLLKAPRGTKDPFTTAVLRPLAIEAAQRLFIGRRPDEHAFLMLGVGIDLAPGSLYIDDDGRLLASWNVAANAPLSSTQERLMHDVANALGGTMRLNPDATTRQRPVTVHSLGGCAMSNTSADGVTDGNGKVWGTRALYVLDGAAMPSSLGTNPSATIAAIAERNVRKALSDPASPIYTATPVPLDPPLPGGDSLAEIRRRLGQTAAVLDPIAAISAAAPPPSSAAVGFEFTEIMDGFYKSDEAGVDAVWLPITVTLHATIDDLNAFLVNPEHSVRLHGSATLGAVTGGSGDYTATGTLKLLRRIEAVQLVEDLFTRAGGLASTLRNKSAPLTDKEHADLAALVDQIQSTSHRYEMTYALTLSGPDGTWDFQGVKKVYGGSGLAVWRQTTTLDITLCGPSHVTHRGRMRVHLADFLRTQLPSFAVSGTEDDARVAWGFERFFRFFFGTLRQVYLPNAQLLDPFGDQRP